MSARLDSLQHRFEQVDRRLTGWMARHGIVLLRISIGVIYTWFGVI